MCGWAGGVGLVPVLPQLFWGFCQFFFNVHYSRPYFVISSKCTEGIIKTDRFWWLSNFSISFSMEMAFFLSYAYVLFQIFNFVYPVFSQFSCEKRGWTVFSWAAWGILPCHCWEIFKVNHCFTDFCLVHVLMHPKDETNPQ